MVPNSPDLNPIENCWAKLKERVFTGRTPVTMKQLNSRLVKEWGNIKPSFLKDLVHSMPNRLQAVIRMNGGYSGY